MITTGDSIFERDAVRRVVINRPTANRKLMAQRLTSECTGIES